MALIHADGFDHWGNTTAMAACYSAANGFAFDTANARTGACIAHTGSGFWELPIPGGEKTQLVFGMAFRMDQTPNNDQSIRFLELVDNTGWNGGTVGVLGLTAGYGFVLFMNYFGTTVKSPGNLWKPAVWNYIEVFVDSSQFNAYLIVRINGDVVWTSPTNSIGARAIAFVRQETVGQGGLYVDDFYICDTTGSTNNAFLGDRRMRTILPNSDAALQAWAPNSGTTGYTQVDEVPPNGDSDYIATAVPGISEFGLSDIPLTVFAVSAVAIYTTARRTDSGAATMRTNLVTASGTLNSPTITPTSGPIYGTVKAVFEKAGGGAVWSATAVNAMTMQIERVA